MNKRFLTDEHYTFYTIPMIEQKRPVFVLEIQLSLRYCYCLGILVRLFYHVTSMSKNEIVAAHSLFCLNLSTYLTHCINEDII